MNEIFPVLYGVCVGFVCSFIAARRWRYLCCVGLSALFGVAATLLTGEWKFGWEFLLIDIPLVAGGSFAVMALRNRMKRWARVYQSGRGNLRESVML
jgi:ABC-type Mn2+/Zn2+ transport system permease subunit